MNAETYDIEAMTEATRIPAKTGNIIQVFLSWRGRLYVIKMFFPSVCTTKSFRGSGST